MLSAGTPGAHPEALPPRTCGTVMCVNFHNTALRTLELGCLVRSFRLHVDRCALLELAVAHVRRAGIVAGSLHVGWIIVNKGSVFS